MKTKNILKRQVKFIMKETLLNTDSNIQKLISSGAIDLEAITKDDYSIAKCIASAIFDKYANDLIPLSNENKKELKNIKKGGKDV